MENGGHRKVLKGGSVQGSLAVRVLLWYMYTRMIGNDCGSQGRGRRKNNRRPVQQLVGSGSVRIWTTSSYCSYFDPGQGEPDIGTGIIDREQVT